MYVYLVPVYLLSVLVRNSLLRYLLLMDVVSLLFSPHRHRLKGAFMLLKRCFTAKRYENLPWSFNINVGITVAFALLFLTWLEGLLWYLDELLFPNYRKTAIENPVFLIGQPRSGTTKFQEVLTDDDTDEHFCSLKLYEMTFPFLTVQYAIDIAAHLDERYLDGMLHSLCLRAGLLHTLPEKGHQRSQMRRVRMDMVDEDDTMLAFTFYHHLLILMFPDPTLVRPLYQFGELPKEYREEFISYHRCCVQKVLYRRGGGDSNNAPRRRYLAKWVTGWGGLLDESLTAYPGGKYVVMVRDPTEQVPSWLKLIGLLGEQISGDNQCNFMVQCPATRQAVIDLNREWYEAQVGFCQKLKKMGKECSDPRLYAMRYTDFVKDMRTSVDKVFKFLNIEEGVVPGSPLDVALQRHCKLQSFHRPTVIRRSETLVTEDEIVKTFPALLEVVDFD